MKTTKYIISLLFLMLTTALSAQVVEVESYFQSKYYLSNIDSIVYVPAQDWSITANVDRYYIDEATQEAHAVVSIEVGPNATIARAGFGDVWEDSISSTKLTAGTTQTIDVVLPDKEKANVFNLYTTNVYYPYYDYRTSIVLDNVSWTKVGTGTYTYTIMYDEPTEDSGYEIYQRDDKPDTYKVTDWFYGKDLIFTWDGKNGNGVTVPASFTGYTHPSYGDVYVSDLYNYMGYSYDEAPCTYDAATQTFAFYVAYWVEAGNFGYGIETLKVNWGDTTPAAARAAEGKNLPVKTEKTVSSLEANSRKAPNANVRKIVKTPKEVKHQKANVQDALIIQ